MAYLGRGLDKISNIEVLDNITFDGSSSYSITKGSVAFTPNSAQSCLISIDGVVQATNFTVSSSTIDFGVAVPSTSTCNFFLHYGTGVMTVPSDGSVTNAKLGSGSFSNITGVGTLSSGLTLSDNILFDTASKGIYLGVTSATASNLLDDYEEGTWTPTLSSGTCTVISATYTKIGNQCTLHFHLANFSDTSTTTDVIITGIPFTQPSNTETGVGSAYGERTDVNKRTLELNSNNIRLRDGFGVSTFDTPLKYSDINNGADLALIASVTYETA